MGRGIYACTCEFTMSVCAANMRMWLGGGGRREGGRERERGSERERERGRVAREGAVDSRF